MGAGAMKRYGFSKAAVPAYEYCEEIDGEWVRFEDAQLEFQRLMDAAMILNGQIVSKDAQIEALKAELVRKGWQPIESATKDKPILGWCVHEADPYFRENGDLTLYGAHVEGLSHVEDGPHVLVWGGGFDDRSYEEPNGGWLPDWWFRSDSDFEIAANPTHWKPIDAP
jgi:hypothetical protein